MKARTLDRANVNKHVRPTIVRLNKAEAFLAVEPLHNTRCHFPSLQCSPSRLLPTQHVSKFDPAMSWGKKPYRAWPSRQPDNSNIVILSLFGKIDTRTTSGRRAELTRQYPGRDHPRSPRLKALGSKSVSLFPHLAQRRP